jgi:tRNA pseudouridine13 synthase
MTYKIKVKPEDFMVNEIADLPLNDNGAYAVYLLTKQGWNTVDALLKIAEHAGISLKDISYGGKKDRYGLTKQYITIRHKKPIQLKEQNYALAYCGRMDRQMGPDLIKENEFSLTVRNIALTDEQRLVRNLVAVKMIGFPNYFDDQRFGGYDSLQGFLGEKVLKQHHNGALKVYLTGIHPEDKKAEKERKHYFFEHWKDWQACGSQAKTAYEKKVFDALQKKPGDFLALLKQIPREVMSFSFSAYQSYLWNELLRRWISKRIPAGLVSVPGTAGEYVFYSAIDNDTLRYFQSLVIPTADATATMPDPEMQKMYGDIFIEQKLRPALFRKIQVRQAFYKSFDRKAIILPEDLRYAINDDEVYPGKRKAELSFRLPRGVYATMLIKRLFC